MNQDTPQTRKRNTANAEQTQKVGKLVRALDEYFAANADERGMPKRYGRVALNLDTGNLPDGNDVSALPRLQAWLSLLEEDAANAPDKSVLKERLRGLYTWLLQAWLDYHGIEWPAQVFVTDAAVAGPGRRHKYPAYLVDRMEELHNKQKLAWPDALLKAFSKSRYSKLHARAKDRLWLGNKAHDIRRNRQGHVRKDRLLDRPALDSAYRVLGLPLDKADLHERTLD